MSTSTTAGADHAVAATVAGAGHATTPAVPVVSIDRFTQWLNFCWRPDIDGQAYHVTAGDNGGPTEWGFTFSTYAGWCRMHGEAYPTIDAFKALSQCPSGIILSH